MKQPINFHLLTILSISSRRQLAGAYAQAQSKSKLIDLILSYMFCEKNGTYIPISPSVNLCGKLPTYSKVAANPNESTLSNSEFFTNALVIPEGYGSKEFDHDTAIPPSLRLTNSGFLFVTVEFDCITAGQFEENLRWLRATNGKGSFESTSFARLDRELSRFKDYRGFSAVFSGNRSVHFHFIFSTEHLENAPYDAEGDQRRIDQETVAALMTNVYQCYWDRTWEAFQDILDPTLKPDRQMRSPTQWRRTPEAIRALERNSIIGILEGTSVSQLVLREKIRDRAPKGSRNWLVSPTHSIKNPISKSRVNGTGSANSIEPTNPEELELLQQMCSDEWGEFPKPVVIRKDGGHWIIYFRNHMSDRKPSTFVKGGFRRLVLLGNHDLRELSFFLPDRLSANGIIEHIRRRLGQEPSESDSRLQPSEAKKSTDLERPLDKLRALSATPIQERHARGLARDFPEPLSETPRKDVVKSYREKVQHVASAARWWGNDVILISVEGAGKTTAHLPILAAEAMDAAVSREDDVHRFAGFAFRSRAQARQRAAEFRALGYRVVVVRSFWDHYSEACRQETNLPIRREDFEDIAPAAVHEMIRIQQPTVFARLEVTRKGLWRDAPCDSGSTIIVTTHKTLQTWHTSLLTRSWHHPDFDPNSPCPDQIPHKTLTLANFVVDDPEVDDLIDILPEALYKFIASHQAKRRNWKHLSRTEQIGYFRSLEAVIGNLIADFERFNELMRTDLSKYDLLAVDYNKIPFGFDNGEHGIYKRTNGQQFYTAVKEWLSRCHTRLTFLTTEQLVAELIQQAYATLRRKERDGKRKEYSRQPPFIAALTEVPMIYPVSVPVLIDKRANARNVKELCRSILDANGDALVIADGVHDAARDVITFQSMKGLNDFTEKNIYVVMAYLAPLKYAELNILGQWLGNDHVIRCYYQDQLHQAVGRNHGFRLSNMQNTKIVVVCSRRMWSSVVSKLQGRVQLYEPSTSEAA